MSGPIGTELSSYKLSNLTADQLRARAMAGGTKVRRRGTWYVTLQRLRSMRAYQHTIFWTALGTPVLYVVAMGLGLGSLVGGDSGSGIDGVKYLVFIAPALLVTSAVSVASEEMTYPVMQGFKWNPIFFAMNAAPLSPRQIINGLVFGVLFRLGFVTTVYYAVLIIFGAVPSAWGFLMIPIGMLTALAFNTPIMAYTSSLRQDTGQIAIIMRFLVMPLTLFSGTFFPLNTMPIYLQPIGWLSPMWHGSQLARWAAYGLSESGLLMAVHVLYLVALTVIGWMWTQRIAARRLNR